jgi:3-oxoadipate enol-lactonase
MLIYQDIGKGIPIVFIHGLGSKKEAWRAQHDLANQYRLILPDLRGHGKTNVNGGFSMKNFAFDIIYLLEYLKIPSAFICGLSLGGIVAQELYRQRPDMVKGLILCNTTSYIPALLTYSLIRQTHRWHQSDKQRLLEQIVQTSIYDQSYKEETTRAFQIRDSYMECAKAPIGLNYFPLLPIINKPVLLIGSTHDQVTPLFNLYLMKQFIRYSHSVILFKTGHLSNIERRQHFNQSILHFMAKSA